MRAVGLQRRRLGHYNWEFRSSRGSKRNIAEFNVAGRTETTRPNGRRSCITRKPADARIRTPWSWRPCCRQAQPATSLSNVPRCVVKAPPSCSNGTQCATLGDKGVEQCCQDVCVEGDSPRRQTPVCKGVGPQPRADTHMCAEPHRHNRFCGPRMALPRQLGKAANGRGDKRHF